MRITKHPVLDITEAKMVPFTFDGKAMSGREGEMVSSALFANGVQSFSIHHVDDAPQGIFCADGQCAQCTVIINGHPQKSCVTPLQAGMVIETLVHFPELPPDDQVRPIQSPQELECDVLVIGGGPSGITSALELADQGFSVILVDDKDRLGGKLVLQTHKFFGSEADCYAGTRGTHIGKILEGEINSKENVTVLTNSTVVGIYSDRKAGVFQEQQYYNHISFQALIVATGARERSLLFYGNDLPGVYGAGAFQTLVNRDLVKSSERVLIVGAGNVGLIGAYHALQAGIEVVAIIDIAEKIAGYKVHADKIKRLGVPIYLQHTIISAEGDGKVERATIAAVDEDWNPLLATARTFEVDTVLIAAGLISADEFYDAAVQGGFPVLKAGDAQEIAEASSAIMGGRIMGREMARILGKDVSIPAEWDNKAQILKSPPGRTFDREHTLPSGKDYKPIFHCYQEIPCDACTAVCPFGSIQLVGETGTILDLPQFGERCIGCALCVASCPGLAITLLHRSEQEQMVEVGLPHEFDHDYRIGDEINLQDTQGEALTRGVVKNIEYIKKYRTHIITVEVPESMATQVAGIRLQDEKATLPLKEADYTYMPDNAIVCRCERISVGKIVGFVQENKVTDLNQLKSIRVGMGACGGKTCTPLLPRVLAQAGVDVAEITPPTNRPLEVEIPMRAIANQGGDTE